MLERFQEELGMGGGTLWAFPVHGLTHRKGQQTNPSPVIDSLVAGERHGSVALAWATSLPTDHLVLSRDSYVFSLLCPGAASLLCCSSLGTHAETEEIQHRLPFPPLESCPELLCRGLKVFGKDPCSVCSSVFGTGFPRFPEALGASTWFTFLSGATVERRSLSE